MIPLIIFGAGTIAKLAWWYFSHDSNYCVRAFCVDDGYIDKKDYLGLPLVPERLLSEKWPPGSCHVFIAVGYQNLNVSRQVILERFVKKGYDIASCVSSRAFILNDGKFGKNCFIMEGAVLQPFSVLGDNCVCWSGSVAAHECRIGNNCFLAANSVVGGMASIGDNTFLGINSTVRDSVRVGKSCLVGAGALVLDNLPDDSLVAKKPSPISQVRASAAMRYINI